jgi:hypothetical protein
LVSNIIVLIGAGIVGWFLAGEPTNVKDLKKGLAHLLGAGIGGGGGADPYGLPGPPGYGPPGGPGFGGGGAGGPPSSDVSQLQQQLQQQQAQSQMQQMQQQFTDQMQQQATAAQMQQMQQQLQAAQQAAAAGGMGGAGASGTPMGVGTTPPNPLSTPGTATPAAADAATTAAQQQMMLPSATAPGIVPGMQQQDPSQQEFPQLNQSPMPSNYPYQPYPGMSPGQYPSNPYTANGMAPLQMPGSAFGIPGLGLPGGYPAPPPINPIDVMFASHFAPPPGPIAVQPPLRAIPNRGWRPPHHGFLGIVDKDTVDHRRPSPFFQGYTDLMLIDLGTIVPGLAGVTVGDLIAFTDSGTGDEIFPIGIDRFDYNTFIEDIIKYVRRVVRNLAGHTPQEKMLLLREIILEASHSRGITAFNPVPPNVITYQNVLATVPRHLRGPSIGHHPRGPHHVGHGGFVTPSKYASLQFKGSNSMPPMIRSQPDQQHKSLFFNK